MNFSFSQSFFTTHIEEAVAQTLSSRFRNTIPKVVPDCRIDLLPKDGEEKINAAIFRTGEVELFEISDTAKFLSDRKIKTVELLEPHCVSKTFIKDTLNDLKSEITAHAKSYEDLLNHESATTDSFIFEGNNGKFFGYTTTLLPHSRTRIASRFAPFLDSGGSIVSVRDRTLPMTHLAIHHKGTSIGAEHTSLFCELSEHSVCVWIVIDCGNDIFSPLVSASSPSKDPSSARFLIDSVSTQTEKHYRLWSPSLAILIDASESDDSAKHQETCELLSESCGKVIELEKDISRYATLYGANLPGGETL